MINAEGHEVPGWVMLRNVQFKHINLCMNELTDDLKDPLAALLRRTNDDFGVTLSGNPIGRECIERLQQISQDVY